MTRLFAASALAPLLACQPGPQGSDSAAPPCTACALTDDHSYTYAADLDAEVVPVRAGQDVRISWEGLDRDVHGHARGADFTVEEARLVAFLTLSPEEVLERLAADQLPQSDVSLFASCEPDGASCLLSAFSVLGNTFEIERYFTEGSGTWLVLLSSSFEAGGHAFVFLEPRDDASASEVAITEATSALSVSVDFAGPDRLRPLVEPDTTLDWSAVSRDGLGNALALHQVDRLMIGQYDGRRPADLQDRVFDLERDADPLWILDVSGRQQATLGEIAGEGALPTPRAGATTLLALSCSSCLNPAPKIVTVLSPE